MNWIKRIFTTEYNVPIVNYFETKVYCRGYFRDPTKTELRSYTGSKPVKMFQNTESHGWIIALYSKDEVTELKRIAK